MLRHASTGESSNAWLESIDYSFNFTHSDRDQSECGGQPIALIIYLLSIYFSFVFISF